MSERRRDLREVADVEPGEGRRDLRDADRAGDATGSSATAARIASKIRELRKRAARRQARKQSQRLQGQRDRRKRREPVRETRAEVSRLRDTISGGGASSALGTVASALGSIGAGSSAGARGEPGLRDDDPARRVGEVAQAGAPVDATLAPFGGPEQAAGPQLLEVMAGGGPREVREARRQERGVADMETFATMAPPEAGDDGVYGDDPLAVDPNPLFGDGGDR